MDFLHNQMRLKFNKLTLNSIYVTLESEWKMFGLGYASDIEIPSNIDSFNHMIFLNPYISKVPHFLVL